MRQCMGKMLGTWDAWNRGGCLQWWSQISMWKSYRIIQFRLWEGASQALDNSGGKTGLTELKWWISRLERWHDSGIPCSVVISGSGKGRYSWWELIALPLSLIRRRRVPVAPVWGYLPYSWRLDTHFGFLCKTQRRHYLRHLLVWVKSGIKGKVCCPDWACRWQQKLRLGKPAHKAPGVPWRVLLSVVYGKNLEAGSSCNFSEFNTPFAAVVFSPAWVEISQIIRTNFKKSHMHVSIR